MSNLGKLIYPRTHPRLRRRKMRRLKVAIVVGAFVACVFGTGLWLVNQNDPAHARPARVSAEKPTTSEKPSVAQSGGYGERSR
jgi:hypothetical protein